MDLKPQTSGIEFVKTIDEALPNPKHRVKTPYSDKERAEAERHWIVESTAECCMMEWDGSLV